jgi:hypothetical protein
MNKKTIKAILDVIKDVSDRPGLYGAQFASHDHISGSPYAYFTDGYVVIRLTCGEYDGLRPINMDMWIGGEQLKELYKKMGARDVCLEFKDDGGDHPDFTKAWAKWVQGERDKSPVAIDPSVFKKLAPFGHMIMYHTDKRLVLFSGRGVNAIACPLTLDAEKELKGV